MTNQEAIGHLRTILIYSETDGYTDEAREALNIAIKALEQVPCEDYISREKTLEKFCDYVGAGMSMNDFDALYDIVSKMPSVRSKTGRWIMHERHRECSECGVYLPKDMPRNSYCPNCGAKMEITNHR